MSYELTISYIDKRFSYNKPTPPPSSSEEIKDMVIKDISFLSNALANLIFMTDKNGYGNKTELSHSAIKTLYDMLKDNEDINKPLNEPEKSS